MACDANTLIANAMSGGYGSLSDRDLKMAALAAACSGAGGIGGGQIVIYTGTNPNTDGVFPADLSKKAIAIKTGSPTFPWSVPDQRWET